MMACTTQITTGSPRPTLCMPLSSRMQILSRDSAKMQSSRLCSNCTNSRHGTPPVQLPAIVRHGQCSMLKRRDFVSSKRSMQSVSSLAMGSAERMSTVMDNGDACFRQPDGYMMELAHQPVEGSDRPPLLFVHGSFHAAWCWQEKFFPYFADHGYESYAVSLRGQGRSQRLPGMKACTLEQHVTDLGNIIASLPRPPVLIGHSFGGLVVQRYITGQADKEEREALPQVTGICLLCAAPAKGNDELVKRVAKKSFVRAAKLTWAMISKNFLTNKAACRDMFFSEDLPESDLERYQRLLRDTAGDVPVIDVSRLKQEVPLPGPPADHPPAFVLGAEDDLIVDVQAVEETAQLYGVSPHILDRCAHDIMLDTRWPEAAAALHDWLEKLRLRSL